MLCIAEDELLSRLATIRLGPTLPTRRWITILLHGEKDTEADMRAKILNHAIIFFSRGASWRMNSCEDAKEPYDKGECKACQDMKPDPMGYDQVWVCPTCGRFMAGRTGTYCQSHVKPEIEQPKE